MSKYKPGEIVTIRGTEFVVLDVEEGTAKGGKDKLFVLLKEPVGSTMFSSDGNAYTKSKLREAVGHWFGEFASDLNKETDFFERNQPADDGRARELRQYALSGSTVDFR